MRAVVQRVTRASVTVRPSDAPPDAPRVLQGEIGPGLVVLLGVHTTDTDAEMDWMVRKVAALRIFSDADGKMNRSVADIGGEVLVVSQFTLYGDAARGNRPSFVEAALPAHAEPLYERFVEALSRILGRRIETGTFGADMAVTLVNDGPVTLVLDRARPATG